MGTAEGLQQLELLCVGMSFIDANFADLPLSGPIRGQEQWTTAWGVGPGGVANFALATAGLGGRVGLATVVGDDLMGRLFLSECERVGVDVSSTVVAEGWRQPITAALTWGGDRALVTGATPVPVDLDAHLRAHPRPATCAIVHLEPTDQGWTAEARARGTRVVGQVGWDESGAWQLDSLTALDNCWAFLPNEDEALNYTRAADLDAAVAQLAERVGVVLVTRGRRGVIGLDAGTGEKVEIPALDVTAVDATGAGDMFGSVFALASARGLGLGAAATVATVVAGIGVSRPGGASSAPRIGEVMAHLEATKNPHTDEIAAAFPVPVPPNPTNE